MPKSIDSKENCDSEYSPTQEPKKIIRRNRKSSYANRVFNSSKWSFKENEEFLNFIEIHKEVLMCSEKRKDTRIFLKLSRTMNSRTPDQCRSHHQKMIKHHNNLDGIIQHLKQRLYSITPNTNQQTFLENPTQKFRQDQQNKNQNSYVTSVDLEMSQENDNKMDSLWEVCSDQMWINRRISGSKGSNQLLLQY